MMILDIHFHHDFLPLLLVIALAWVLPVVLSLTGLTRIPLIIAEIIGGYVLGRLFFDSYNGFSREVIDFLALTGFLFLMFLSGLGIDTENIMASLPSFKKRIKDILQNSLVNAILIFFLTMLLAFSGAFLLSLMVEIKNIWYFSLILVTSSVGVIVPVLKNSGEMRTAFGQMILLAAAVADILSILLFSFTALIIKEGFNPRILLVLILFVAFMVSYKAGKKLRNLKIVKRLGFELSHAASQIQIRASLLIILLFVFLSQLIGEEVMLLGAFLGGLLLSFFLQRGRSVLLLKLDGMGYGFFIPLFFIGVGINFDTSALAEFDNSLWVYLFVLGILFFLVKVVPAMLWVPAFGWKTALSGGFLLASRLSLIIAASQIGLSLGIISPGMNSCFIIMAVISCLFSPLLYNLLGARNKLKEDEIIIVGGSSTSVLLARRLQMHGRQAMIIETNRQRHEDIAAKGIKTVLGDGKDPALYRKLRISPDHYFVVLTDSEKENKEVCIVLKKQLGCSNLITRSFKRDFDSELIRLKVERLDITHTLATAIENLILRPTTYHALLESFDRFIVEELDLTNPDVNGKKVSEVPFHRDGSLILIKRSEDMFVPHGETVLKRGDIVFVFATETAMSDYKQLLC